MLIKGVNLTKYQRKQVLAAFIYRNTFQKPMEGIVGVAATLSDDQWIEAHAFNFIKSGKRMSRRHSFCVPEYLAD